MAGRKDKNTVDYFPHYCVGGKTQFIIESKFGNNGYAVLFKTFEVLGVSENHYFDARTLESQEYLSAKMKIGFEELLNIYNTLTTLGTFHKELWENKIIYSVNFLKNIADVYKRRTNLCMNFYELCEHLSIKCIHKYDSMGILLDRNIQSKVENTKVEQSKINKLHLFKDSPFYEKKNFIKEFERNSNYEVFDSEYYYEAVKNWSGESNNKKANWILTARNWAMRDYKENKPKIKNHRNESKRITGINSTRIGSEEYKERTENFLKGLASGEIH